MSFPATLILVFSLFLQADWAPSYKGDIFTSKEVEKLEKERDVNDRIKVYTNASKRIRNRLSKAASRGQFQGVPGDLELWTVLLANSLKDIKANLDPGKKSKNLIRFEIEVRKSLDDIKDFKIRAPIDQQDAFDACLSKAEAIRQQLVEIIFPR
jgi:hypothetical protein